MMRRSSVPVRRNRKGHHPDGESSPKAHHQLSLAIDTPRIAVGEKPGSRQRMGREPVKRALTLEEILWMRDVVQLTGKHRSTIHRWIHRGIFPRKNAPRGQPTGWLRSTIEQWLLGLAPTSREVESDASL